MLKLVKEVDLGGVMEPVYLDRRYARAYIVATFQGFVLCTFEMECDHGSRAISVTRLRAEALARGGCLLWEKHILGRLEAPPNTWPSISVIVCTKDRASMLERCLASLQLLDYPNYEVVVIDNCSSDPKVAEVIARSGFRHAREDRPGLDWARNRGIKEAKFDIISYIDDDAIAWPGWLRGIAGGFVDPSVMAVTGLVLPSELDTEAQGLFEGYGGMGKGFSPRTINRTALSSRAVFAVHNCGVGANMAFRRALFDKVGCFDTALDVGTPSEGAGDLDMFHRVIAAGLTIRYEPHAVIWHTHRRSLTALRRQIYANGRSYGVYLMKCFKSGSGGRSSAFSYALTWFFGSVIKRLFSRKLRKDGFPAALLRAEFWGALHAPWAYIATMKHDRRLRVSSATISSATGGG